MEQVIREAFEEVGAGAMVDFTQWLMDQDTEITLRGMAYVSVVAGVLGGIRTTQFRGFAVPDYWSMELALVALQVIAREQGFLDAVAFCDETLQEAREGIMGFTAFIKVLQEA